MSIFLHQIGDVVVNIHSTNVAPLRVSTPRRFKGEARQLDNGVMTTFTQVRQLPEPQEVSIEGTITCEDCLSVNEQINLLMSMGGIPYIDVIGYLPNPCCGSGSCSQCNDCLSGHPVQWVTTRGMITNIERAATLEDRKLHSAHAAPVMIEMTLDPYWYPLDKFQWQVIRGTTEVDLSGLVTALQHDSAHLPYAPGNFVFRKKVYSDWHMVYRPEMWTNSFFNPDEFTVSPYQSDTYMYRVLPNRRRWNAPPCSVYAFRNLAPTGLLVIKVESEIGPGQIVYRTTALNLEALNTLLQQRSLTGLTPADTVYATDTLHTPGFILRNNIPLLYQGKLIKLEWSYPDEYPGQLIGRRNVVSFEGVTEGAAQVAWSHQHRML